MYYHGTTIANITTLVPKGNPDNLIQKPRVYLTSSFALSLIYIWKFPYKWMTFDFDTSGLPVYTESFSGSLKQFYSGVRGYVYLTEAIHNDSENVGIKNVIALEEPIAVKKCILIDDVYEALLAAEANGQLMIRRFETLNEKEQLTNDKMVLNAIKHFELLKKPHPMGDFVKLTFPNIWKEALYALGGRVPLDPSNPI